jgi:glycosyltransferase involved in cell wall biosynthesis
MTGLHLAVDGVGLSRSLAGVGVYTTEILHAMAVDRPDCRLTVYVPRGVSIPAGAGLTSRPIPETPLVGRHLQWPARLRRLKPDAFFGPVGALPLTNVGCPAVITVHDLAIYRNPSWFPSRQPLSTRFVVPRSLERADSVIAVSKNTARDLEELFGVPGSRITVVPEGAASSFRPLGSEALAEARVRLQLPERFILFVSTIEPRKNLDTLLEAWAMMRHRPDLVVVGGWGWNFEPVRQRMSRVGAGLHHVERIERADLPAVYNLARILAHPAWYEGFGLTPLEAMACGTPVVVSDRSSLPELVGEAGMVVAADDPEAWRRALEKVMDDADLAADLRRRGILRAAEFSWSRAAAMTWNAIDRVVAPRRPARG